MKKNLTKKIKYLASGDNLVPVELVEEYDVNVPEEPSPYYEHQARLKKTSELLENYDPTRKDLHEWFQEKHPVMYHAARSKRNRGRFSASYAKEYLENGIEPAGVYGWYPGQHIISSIGVAHNGTDANVMLDAIDRYSSLREYGMTPTEAFNKLSDVDRNQLSFFFDLSY